MPRTLSEGTCRIRRIGAWLALGLVSVLGGSVELAGQGLRVLEMPAPALSSVTFAAAQADGRTPDAGSPSQPAEDGAEQTAQTDPPVTIDYGSRGLEIATRDGNYLAQIEWRIQTRYSYPFDGEPQTARQFEAEDSSTFTIRRARFKLRGHAYRPWLDYELEYDMTDSRLLSLQLTLSRQEWLQFRLGQSKVPFSRERLDSSGRLQFADRSIVNRDFSLDRQEGASVFGRIKPGTRADSWYHAGVFTGTGIGGVENDDSRMLWVGRYQWNFLGQDMPFSQTDVEIHEKPAAAVAFAAATNRSQFTRFSSSGGGQLDGFAPGLPGQYDIDQWTEDAVVKYRGFSVQHEYHWKRIEDTLSGRRTELSGMFLQAGVFPHHWFPDVAEPLEVAVRFASIDPDRSVDDDVRREYTVGANWFMAGHRNKLTVDLSRLTLQQSRADSLSDVRFRVQWDVSF